MSETLHSGFGGNDEGCNCLIDLPARSTLAEPECFHSSSVNGGNAGAVPRAGRTPFFLTGPNPPLVPFDWRSEPILPASCTPGGVHLLLGRDRGVQMDEATENT